MLTAADYQAVLLREIGAGLEGMPDTVLAKAMDVITPFLPTYWEMWTYKAAIWPGLQMLYVKRQCLNVLLGMTRDLLNVTIGGAATINQGQIFNNLQTLHKICSDEITRIEDIAQKSRPPVIAKIPDTVFDQDTLGRVYRVDQQPWIRSQPPPADMYGRGW